MFVMVESPLTFLKAVCEKHSTVPTKNDNQNTKISTQNRSRSFLSPEACQRAQGAQVRSG